jgi:3,4-dihydroxy 2-butanone 4-phosphate synthase/GTP cyclohydrolase II
MDPGQHNASYLQTKQDKLGHLMGGPEAPGGGPAAVLAWQGSSMAIADGISQGISPEAANGSFGGADADPDPGSLGPNAGEQDQREQLSSTWDALLASHWQDLNAWAAQHQLELQREEHPRLLALLDRPSLAVLVTGSSPEVLQSGLARMASWTATLSVCLLLAPDAQRSTHPSVSIEAERRPLRELVSASALLPRQPSGLTRWC